MLQQILRDLYVDPELLSGLDEGQKETLFCKMREEQVRRYHEWDAKCGAAPPTHGVEKEDKKNKKKKHVTFLHGADGEPWVWVMGEHRNDMSIDDILKAEAIEKARALAEREAEALRHQLIVCIAPNIEEDIYCSVEDARAMRGHLIDSADDNSDQHNTAANNHYKIGHYKQDNKLSNNKHNVITANDALNEWNRSASKKVAQKIAQWEKRLTEERTTEIFQTLQSKRLQADKEAEENEHNDEQFWQEQERKAKEAELHMREIARKAREDHKRNNCNLKLEPALSADISGVPPSREAVIQWYRSQEIPRGAGVNKNNKVEPYFYGLITRSEAESLLQDQAHGAYLVRLSKRLWGYAISYKGADKIKHYLVSAISNYTFLGANQLEHQTLGDLLSFHKDYPLSGGEKLVKPCPRSQQTTLDELLRNALSSES